MPALPSGGKAAGPSEPFIRFHELPWPTFPPEVLPPGPVVFLDIETTGLSAWSHHVTLVGMLLPVPEQGLRRVEQYFVHHPSDEAEVLQHVALCLQRQTRIITYNGKSFDVPFLQARAERHGIRWPAIPHLDLLQITRSLQLVHGRFPNCRLQTVMSHFGLVREDRTSGLEMVRAYARWLRNRDVRERDEILAHNRDDLLYLPELLQHLTVPLGDPGNAGGG